MYYQDLATIGLSESLIAIGWLSPSKTYNLGKVDAEDFLTLENLVSVAWQPFHLMGFHSCGLCLYRGEASGSKNLFVPGKEGVFLAPELILHYMNAHHYCPPEDFLVSVRNCPDMGSMDYKKALLKSGGPGLIEKVRHVFLPVSKECDTDKQ